MKYESYFFHYFTANLIAFFQEIMQWFYMFTYFFLHADW